MEPTAQQSRGKKFVRDLGIYAIGNIGSKLITFLLVPFYTYFITDPADFGYYDICLTVIFCFSPIVGMQLQEAAFRYLIELPEEYRKQEIITFVIKVICKNSVLVGALALIASLFVDIKYFSLIILFGLTQTVYDVYSQIIRGLSYIKYFMAMGIITSTLIALLSIVFIAIFKLGLLGMFISNIGARIIGLCVIENRIKIIRRYFSVRAKVELVSKEMLKYSLPLIPQTFLWSAFSILTVFFVEHFLGLNENGIYGVVAKFSSILFVLTNIFQQTWQQNAMEQYNSSDRDLYFSTVFNNYVVVLSLLLCIFPFCLRINYFWLVGAQYQISYKYIFLNCINVALFSLFSFFVLGYQCSKQTKRILPGLLISILSLILLNYMLVPKTHLYGTIIATMIAYSILAIYFIIDTRRYFKIKFSFCNLASLILVVSFCIIYQITNLLWLDVIAIVIAFPLYWLIFPRNLTELVKTKF